MPEPIRIELQPEDVDPRMAQLNLMQRQRLEASDASIETLVDYLCLFQTSSEHRERVRSALYSMVNATLELSRLRP